jgi:hypothetical protein
LYAAIFTAFSGFVIGYSQEMRAYIFKICMAPLASLCLLRIMQSFSAKHLFLYLVLYRCCKQSLLWHSVRYGEFFVFCLRHGVSALMEHKKNPHLFYRKRRRCRKFLPIFLYMIFYNEYNFEREFTPQVGHIFLFAVTVLFMPCFFLFKDKLKKLNLVLCNSTESMYFAPYCILAPAFIFCCAFLISFVKPMITFRYLWPVCAPYFSRLPPFLFPAPW